MRFRRCDFRARPSRRKYCIADLFSKSRILQLKLEIQVDSFGVLERREKVGGINHRKFQFEAAPANAHRGGLGWVKRAEVWKKTVEWLNRVLRLNNVKSVSLDSGAIDVVSASPQTRKEGDGMV